MLGNVVPSGLDADRSMKALGRLGETAITLKKRVGVGVARGIFTVSLPRLFSDLTEKQLLALLEALDNGYYKVPRTVTTADWPKPRECRERPIRSTSIKLRAKFSNRSILSSDSTPEARDRSGVAPKVVKLMRRR